MSRLTRDGTAESVSRDQIFRRVRGQGKICFPVQLTTRRIGNLTRLIHTLAIRVNIHTYQVYVEIFRHKKVMYLKVFSWRLLLNNGEKNTVVVLNNRRHLLMISHKQRNTAEFLRIPCFRVVSPGILHKESPREIKKICKE